LFKAIDTLRGTDVTPKETPAAASPTPEGTPTRTRG
jgi:hypothetical protein